MVGHLAVSLAHHAAPLVLNSASTDTMERGGQPLSPNVCVSSHWVV